MGDTKPIEVDVRLIAASNRNLEKAVADGILREDLFYRLNVIPIHIPPLRDRREDVPLLVSHFLKKSSADLGKDVRGVAPEAMRILEAYDWPGNIRELQNVIERAVALGSSEVVTGDALPESLRSQRSPRGMELDLPEDGLDLEATLDRIERTLLQKALERTNRVQTRAAALLRLTFRSFRYKLQKHQLSRERGDRISTPLE